MGSWAWLEHLDAALGIGWDAESIAAIWGSHELVEINRAFFLRDLWGGSLTFALLDLWNVQRLTFHQIHIDRVRIILDPIRCNLLFLHARLQTPPLRIFHNLLVFFFLCRGHFRKHISSLDLRQCKLLFDLCFKFLKFVFNLRIHVSWSLQGPTC